ncbi:MAG: flagellar motor switch protein FliM, partial [Alphaproteobacteria bacterium]|nr:flagellar motor switch protein FliM [Alphaproteobacteria bacterium]
MSETGTEERDKMSAEERAMMEQWESMATEEEGASAEESADSVPDAEASGGEGSNTRILNQDEIDSLLGFDDDTGLGAETSGVMALVNSAMVNYERLPMLDIVFDRLVRLMSTTLRNLTSDNVEVSLDQVSTVRFGDYMNS